MPAAFTLVLSDATEDTVQEVVTHTINYAILAAAIGGGALAGIVFALAIVFVLKALSRGHSIMRRLLGHARTSLIVANAFWFAHLGIGFVESPEQAAGTSWIHAIDHFLIVATIAAVTWMLVAGAQTIEDLAVRAPSKGDPTRHSKIRTQALMIRRIIQGACLILGCAAIAMTFPAARTAIASVLASAGVASIVATLAAQSMLANIFAGFQIAMTDSMRVGDIIVVSGLDGPKVQGSVEEITLTYVVVHVWDGRRIVIPSSKFTTNEFENLTRRHTEMMASVELKLDYRAPLTRIRAEVDRLLATTDLWDGEDANVQVTASDERTMTVRVVVSARNSANAWDLGCRLREGLLTWLAREAPYALPRARYQELQVEEVDHDLTQEQIADLAEELANISGPGLGHGRSRLAPSENEPAREDSPMPTSILPVSAEDPKGAGSSNDRTHRARLSAAKERSRREVRRRSILKARTRETPREPADTADTAERTAPLTRTTDRLYSGSPSAERRARIYAGDNPETPSDDEDRKQERTDDED